MSYKGYLIRTFRMIYMINDVYKDLINKLNILLNYFKYCSYITLLIIKKILFKNNFSYKSHGLLNMIYSYSSYIWDMDNNGHSYIYIMVFNILNEVND